MCVMAPPRVDIYQRWLAKVDFPTEPDGCWTWKAGRSVSGYGILMTPGRRVKGTKAYLMAHRFSYERHVGPIPDGLSICHRCDNPPCVRPDHLFVGTQGENNQDCWRKGRHPPMRVMRGQDHPSRKLDQAQVDEIRRIYATGTVRQVDLASMFGVEQTAISAIVRGKTWSESYGPA